MRAISLVHRIEFEFTGNVVRNAVVLGDVDNDGCNELIVGNANGDVSIFKGKERIQTITSLSFIACIAVGDILNQNRNSLVIITADGLCYIYETNLNIQNDTKESTEPDGHGSSSSMNETPSTCDSTATSKQDDSKSVLVCVHIQRIPANTKNILLGDVDGDGLNEMVLGLTDRVVRSYRWIPNRNKTSSISSHDSYLDEKNIGKFVALNKWECANQIGSITLHHAWDGKPSLLIAQPGGTFMRIVCETDESFSHSTSSSETIPGSVSYEFLGRSRMRNENISTEILGDFKSLNQNNSEPKGPPYAVATLDGTIMLVQDEVILWAMAVDHQVFALTKLDVTGNGLDDIVVCSWDGQTYILDQEKNTVRFQLDEPVQAFHSGYYTIEHDEPAATCLVYVTFKNKIILYYDIPLKEMICKRFEPDVQVVSELFVNEDRTKEEAVEYVKKMDKKMKRELVEYLLYGS